ncbi:MAG: right-handed parallel beta-helix repeat-containing protein, partial [Bacteroidetes bacterium]|nr:right-handed parallel beta-helix repeat-containing protein [Bacteroidota bacterium]
MKTVFTKFLVVTAMFLFGTMGAHAQLSGNYTIDPSGSGSTNYTSITAAANALMSSGVSGPVTFTIEPGTYNGQVSLSRAITGASSTNTITFKGKSGNRNHVVISNTGTYTLYMISVDYIKFEDVSIVFSGTYGIYLNSQADYNTFDNVRIEYTGSGTGYPCYNYQSEFNSFNDCLFRGGYYGFLLYGWSTSSRTEDCTITNCQFYNQTYMAMYLYYHEDLVMDNIEIDSFSGYYGMYQMYGVRTTLSNSKLNLSSQQYYLYWYYNNYYGSSSDTSHVYNNMIAAWSGSSYGVYGYYMYRNKWYNNSLSFKGSSYGAYMPYPTGSEFMNNNWYANGGTYGIYMYDLPAKMNHNNLDWNGGSYWGVLGTYAFASLAAQKTQYSGYNANSVDVDPEFDNEPRDLRTYSSTLNNIGMATSRSFYLTDIDGNKRPATGDTKYDIGCNEYYLSPYDLDIKAIPSPVSVNPTNNNTISVFCKNSGSGTLSNESIAFQYSTDSGKTWSSAVGHTISSLAPGATFTKELTTTWNPNRTGDFRIYVRMSTQVTGDPDAKDEAFVDVCSGMSGRFTVGNRGGADFPDLTSALAKLKCGLAGNVTFTLLGKNGGGQETYPSIQLNNIHGTSSAQLTIDGQHKDSVKISFTGSGFTGNIDLNNCSYMNFTNMTIDMNTGTTAGAHIYNGAHHNSITNCYINGNNSTSNVG